MTFDYSVTVDARGAVLHRTGDDTRPSLVAARPFVVAMNNRPVDVDGWLNAWGFQRPGPYTLTVIDPVGLRITARVVRL